MLSTDRQGRLRVRAKSQLQVSKSETTTSGRNASTTSNQAFTFRGHPPSAAPATFASTVRNDRTSLSS